MLQAVAQLQKDNAQSAITKKVKAKHMLDEIFAANQRAILVKKKRILEEKEEEEKITAYNRAKARKEAEFEAEQRRIKDEKEREV